ncbi:hypothetical protein [Hyphomicrobium sp. ghe19]|uniref:hypothetical protein n=1 Tax=Hyphomicrobium sp. ghe19 TaxID=2682968 RepID=UPI001366A9C9|nr:hypothetical protein HYPP_01507 [Hyphomicrobium sp. ghe19]
MDYLAFFVLLAILALFIIGGGLLMLAALFEDVVVRPITEDEFSRYLSRPPNSI